MSIHYLIWSLPCITSSQEISWLHFSLSCMPSWSISEKGKKRDIHLCVDNCDSILKLLPWTVWVFEVVLLLSENKKKCISSCGMVYFHTWLDARLGCLELDDAISPRNFVILFWLLLNCKYWSWPFDLCCNGVVVWRNSIVDLRLEFCAASCF